MNQWKIAAIVLALVFIYLIIASVVPAVNIFSDGGLRFSTFESIKYSQLNVCNMDTKDCWYVVKRSG